MKQLLKAAVLINAINLTCVSLAAAQTPHLGEIRLFGFNFCPIGWRAADGATLSISENQALFALLGTFFGGNGINNFALPNLSGRAPYGMQSGEAGQPIGAEYGAPISSTGGTQGTALSLKWCVAMQGIFPSREAETPTPPAAAPVVNLPSFTACSAKDYPGLTFGPNVPRYAVGAINGVCYCGIWTDVTVEQAVEQGWYASCDHGKGICNFSPGTHKGNQVCQP
jgi:Phage Tail Collar Domain